jgi:hypothetical protein
MPAAKVVGASKTERDITEQKRNQELFATLAREAEHRSKNVLANALATVNLSQSSSPEDLKETIWPSLLGMVRSG